MAYRLLSIVRSLVGPRLLIVVLFSALALGSYVEAASSRGPAPGAIVSTTSTLDLALIRSTAFGDWEDAGEH